MPMPFLNVPGKQRAAEQPQPRPAVTQQDTLAALQQTAPSGEAFQSKERIADLKLDLLIDHPKMNDFSMDEAELEPLMESISVSGILQPIIVRPHPTLTGRYQVLAGHRRKAAATKLGMTTVPCSIMELNDNQAETVFYATNLTQRESLKPSERANGYARMKEALEKEGAYGSNAASKIADLQGYNIRQVRRYIKMATLNKLLLNKIDEGGVSVNAGAILADLTATAQENLAAVMDVHDSHKLTEEQAKAVVALPRHDNLTIERCLFPLKEKKEKVEKPKGYIKLTLKEIGEKMDIDGLSADEVKELVLALIAESGKGAAGV